MSGTSSGHRGKIVNEIKINSVCPFHLLDSFPTIVTFNNKLFAGAGAAVVVMFVYSVDRAIAVLNNM